MMALLRLLLALHASLVVATPASQLRPVVHRAMESAGQSILRNFNTIGYNNAQVESKIGSRDIVTKTDQECQEIVKNIILENFPSHKFLGDLLLSYVSSHSLTHSLTR